MLYFRPERKQQISEKMVLPKQNVPFGFSALPQSGSVLFRCFESLTLKNFIISELILPEFCVSISD